MNIGLINKNTKNTDTHGYAILNYTSRNTDSHKKLIILLDISQTLQILTDIFSGHSKTSYGSFIYSTIGGLFCHCPLLLDQFNNKPFRLFMVLLKIRREELIHRTFVFCLEHIIETELISGIVGNEGLSLPIAHIHIGIV